MKKKKIVKRPVAKKPAAKKTKRPKASKARKTVRVVKKKFLSRPAKAKRQSKKPTEAAVSYPQREYQPSFTAKMQVEVSKFDTASAKDIARQRRKEISLPLSYGDNKIVAMVRDPWWIYVYWEITPHKESETRGRMRQEGAEPDRSILRVYDVTGIKDFNGSNANSYFDITLKDVAQNWYIDVSQPNRDWCIDIGILAGDKRFYLLARSNKVQTPRFGMSEILDEEWMCPEEEYWKLFGLSGGLGIGKSSMEIKEIFQKHFKEWVSSGAMSSFSSFVLANKG